jgi:ribose transport system permease protein
MDASIERRRLVPAMRFPKLSRLPHESGVIAAIVVLSLLFQFISGSFLTFANVASVLEAAAVPTVLVTGLSFVIILGGIDLSLEGIAATTSMVLALLVANNVNHHDLGVLGILAAIGCGLAFGLLNGVLNAILRMPSLLVTLGTWFIGLGIAAVLFPQKIPEIHEALVAGIVHVRLFGLSLIVYFALTAVVIAHLVLNYTRLGRMIYAIGGDEAVVVASGIRVARFKVAAFAISGTLAAVGGVLLSAQLDNGNANIGAGLLFPAISAAVLGGTLLSGGRGGAVQSGLGALLLEVLNNGLIQIGAGPYVRHIISGAVIVSAVAITGWSLRAKLRVIK